jgi:predicted dehydrogenase
MKKIGFGIVGCGVISHNHAAGVTANDNARLAAVCDIIPEKAQDLAREYGASKVYENYHDLINDPDVDVVNVCTPSGLHAEVAIAAARAGKHVFCEKPMDITADKMMVMIEACDQAGVKFGCVFQRRLMPEAIAARRAVADGTLGKLVLADGYFKYYRSQEYYNSAGWRGTWALDGGGALMNQGIHGIDLLDWMTGGIETVYAHTKTLAREIEVEDTAVILLTFKNGALGVIEGTTSVYPAQETRFALHGSLGTVEFSDLGMHTFETLDGKVEFSAQQECVGGAADPKAISVSGHTTLIGDMADAVLNDHEPLIPGRQARRAVDIILAIYESSRTGHPVTIG